MEDFLQTRCASQPVEHRNGKKNLSASVQGHICRSPPPQGQAEGFPPDPGRRAAGKRDRAAGGC